MADRPTAICQQHVARSRKKRVEKAPILLSICVVPPVTAPQVSGPQGSERVVMGQMQHITVQAVRTKPGVTGYGGRSETQLQPRLRTWISGFPVDEPDAGSSTPVLRPGSRQRLQHGKLQSVDPGRKAERLGQKARSQHGWQTGPEYRFPTVVLLPAPSSSALVTCGSPAGDPHASYS